MAAHTPGQWQLGQSGNCNVVSFDGDDVRPIAYVGSEANAHLIAAAPDLLTWLKKLVERAQREMPDPIDVDEIQGSLAAIRKAEGQS